MKSILSRMVPLLITSFYFIKTANAQEIPIPNTGLSTSVRQGIDQPIDRHKWEININLIPLFKLQSADNWAYSYLLKRNVGQQGKLGAFRFMISPNLLKKNQQFTGDSSINFSNPKSTYFAPSAILGYEWQKVKGRFVFFYGADFGWRTELDKFHDDNAVKNFSDGTSLHGKLRTKSVKNVISASPLLGAKLYLNHRFSISLESQVRFLYSKRTLTTYFNEKQLSKDLLKQPEIATFGYYVLNISYNL